MKHLKIFTKCLRQSENAYNTLLNNNFFEIKLGFKWKIALKLLKELVNDNLMEQIALFSQKMVKNNNDTPVRFNKLYKKIDYSDKIDFKRTQ